MKKLLTILCLVLLVSCSNEVPEDKLVYRQGITYEVNSTTPFTGQSVKYWRDIELSKNSDLVVVEEIRERISYKNGKRDGLHESFYENDQLETRGNNKNGEINGVQEWFHDNGQLGLQVDYKDGKKRGLYIEYSRGGELIKKIRYGITEGDTRGWSWDGKYNEEGQPKGEWENFDENGNLYSRGNYKNGKRDDLYESFYENDQLETRGNFKEGKKEGLWEWFNENGQLKSRENWKDGKRNRHHEYFEEGNLYLDGEMFDDIKIKYSKNGQPENKIYYKNKREVINTRFYYHENGQLGTRGNWKDDEQEGLWEYFDRDGNLTDTKEWKNGELIKQ